MMGFINKLLRNFSPRERKLIVYGAVLVLIAVCWVFIYKPITKTLSDRIELNQTLLSQYSEMQNSVKELKTDSTNIANKRPGNKTFISWIDEQLVNNQLSEYVSRSEPKDNRILVITFDNVKFDDFIAWLQPLIKTYSVHVSEADINLTDETNGLCNIRLTLEDNV